MNSLTQKIFFAVSRQKTLLKRRKKMVKKQEVGAKQLKEV